MKLPKLFSLAALCLPFLLTSNLTAAPAVGDDFLLTPHSSRLSHTISYRPLVHLLVNQNTPLVEVKINGAAAKTFLLDTGSSLCAIKDTLVSKLKKKGGISDLPGKPYEFAGKPTGAILVDSVNLGGFNLNNFVFMPIPDKNFALYGGSQTDGLDGILGLSMVANLEYLFDFPRHQITMYAPTRIVTPPDGSPAKYVTEGLTPEEVTALGFSSTQNIPIITSAADGRKFVRVMCRKGTHTAGEDMMLDTGSATTALSSSLAAQLALQPLSEGSVATGLNGTRSIKTASLDQLQIGDVVISNPSVTYAGSDAGDKNLPPTLGMDILSKYQVLVDFSSNKMYLKLPETKPFPVKVTIGPSKIGPPVTAP